MTFYSFPKKHWRHLRSCSVVEALLPAVLLLTMACSPVLKSVAPTSAKSSIRTVQDGVTTRLELEEMFGKPGASFEGGRIVAWYLDKKHGAGVSTTVDLKFHLIVVLNERGIVERHSLLRVR